MQEEVENRTLTLVVSGTKFTGRLFKAAISKYMAHRREKEAGKAAQPGFPRHPQGQADGEAAHRAEPGRLQHRDQRPVHQGV